MGGVWGATGYVKWHKVWLVPNMFGFSHFLDHFSCLDSWPPFFNLQVFICVFTPILGLSFLNYTYLPFFQESYFNFTAFTQLSLPTQKPPVPKRALKIVGW